MPRRALLALLPLLGAPAWAQRIELIEPAAAWSYFKGRSEASTPIDAWRQPGFDDTAWAQGPTGIGYGDADDATVLPDMAGNYVSVFLRHRFPIADPSRLRELYLDLSYDDGFVAYLNGVEVARGSLPPGPVAFDTLAPTHEAAAPERFDLSGYLPLLAAGSNVLAIQGHNQALGSSDFSLTPRLFAQGANAVTRGPYLQLQEPGSILVAWRTALPSIGEVSFAAGAPVQVASETLPTTDHAVALAGLTPGAIYTYHVGEGGAALTRDERFRAGRAPGDAGLRVVVLGDSGAATVEQWNVARLIEQLDPDLILHTGDLIYDAGEARNYDPRFFEPYRRLVATRVLWPALGNHDWATASGQPFVDAFHLPGNGDPLWNEHYYAFRYADTLFVALDSQPRPAPGDPQLVWLDAVLGASRDCFKVVFFHHPPYCAGTTHGSDLAIRAGVVPILDRHGVDLVFNGHEHLYERSFPVAADLVVGQTQEPDYVDPAGRIYVVTGGGGRGLYPTGTDRWTARAQMRHHVVVLDRSLETWTLRAVEPDGSPGGVELDRMTLTKSACAAAAYTIFRSPDRFDLPARPHASSAARSWSDPEAAPSIYYYQVAPAALLRLVRSAASADLTW